MPDTMIAGEEQYGPGAFCNYNQSKYHYGVLWQHSRCLAMKYYNRITWKSIGFLLLFQFLAPYTYGQREKNNIYLFDCTGSMKTKGLWEPAKSALDATISTQAGIPNSQFCVIPFGDSPYQSIVFSSEQYIDNMDVIDKAFDKYISQAKFTRISDVLKAGFNNIDHNKENKIYLLTDGMPNGGDTPQTVANVITEWCTNHRNCRLFYVALTNGVINPVIQQAIDACPDAFIVQCEGKVIPQIADISSEIYTNIEELGIPREVSFSIPGKYNLNVESSDSLFNINISGNSANDGKVLISLSPKDGFGVEHLHQILQGGDYSFPIKLQCTDKRFFIANPIVTVNVSDRVQSKLTIAHGFEEIQAKGSKWHDSFLWSDAAPDEKICWDLSPIFKNELQNSGISLGLQAGNKQQTDFQAWYNGQPIDNDCIIKLVPNQSALLEIQFNHNAATGKRYFTLVPIEIDGLNIINAQPAETYKGTSLRTEYNVGWNPLKTFLFWLAIALFAIVIIWIFILKRIFFPTIKMGKVIITGPGTYYASKKIKGARKVILTSRHKSQNIFSRIFTGEIRFIKSEFFLSDLSINPAGGKKKVKLRSESHPNEGWDIYPSSIFGQYDTGSIINRDTKDKSDIEFS